MKEENWTQFEIREKMWSLKSNSPEYKKYDKFFAKCLKEKWGIIFKEFKNTRGIPIKIEIVWANWWRLKYIIFIEKYKGQAREYRGEVGNEIFRKNLSSRYYNEIYERISQLIRQIEDLSKWEEIINERAKVWERPATGWQPYKRYDLERPKRKEYKSDEDFFLDLAIYEHEKGIGYYDQIYYLCKRIKELKRSKKKGEKKCQ